MERKCSKTIETFKNNQTEILETKKVANQMASLTNKTIKKNVFQGWRTETGEVFDVTQPVQSNLTIKAAWAPITWNIQFDANGGTGTMNPQTFAYDEPRPLAVCQFTNSTDAAGLDGRPYGFD